MFYYRYYNILYSTRQSIKNYLVRYSKLDRLAARDVVEVACKEYRILEITKTTFL